MAGDPAFILIRQRFVRFPVSQDGNARRNLIWDMHMFEDALNLDKLKLNTAYHVPEHGDSVVIDYRAMFNTLDAKIPGFAMVGRSDYWGRSGWPPPRNRFGTRRYTKKCSGRRPCRGWRSR